MSDNKPKDFKGFNSIFAKHIKNLDGTISMGYVAEDDVKHAIQLANNRDPRHYFRMESSGDRKSTSTLESPGGIAIKCGQIRERDDGSLVILVENGNVEFDIKNGDFKVKARNVDFQSIYADTNEEGNFTVKANQKIQLDGSIINAFGTQKIEITSNDLLKLMGDMQTDFVTGICNMTSYSTRRGKRPICLDPDAPIPGRVEEGN